MARIELSANRLQAFFEEWAATRTSVCKLTLAYRLTRFFEEFRSLPGSRAARELDVPDATKSRLCLENLEMTLRLLQAPLTRARSAGAFLNVWTTAGLKRDEVRNAAVLASLWDPQTCPETGPAFLWTFLQHAKWSGTSPLISEEDVLGGYSYTVRTEDYPLGCADNRVDLSIEGRDFVIIIEVKIDAGEGTDQLKRYDNMLQAKAMLFRKRPVLIYLSPRAPQNPPYGTAYANWTAVVSAARQVGRTQKTGDRSLVSTLLLHFAAHAANFT